MNNSQALYQIALIGPRSEKYAGTIRRTISSRASDIGIPLKQAFRVLAGPKVRTHDPRFPLVGVYFGGPTPRRCDDNHARVLIDAGALILPVVPTLEDYPSQVPQVLHGVNGIELRNVDDGFERVVQRIYEGLELLRSRRMAFISYRRVEASRLAQQIHDALDARCWQSFLDTHSIDGGVPVQPTLWDRMNDADVLIFLDSPGALKSNWVVQEIEKANQLGMGVLQLVWPQHTRDERTMFATPVYLSKADFVRGSLSRRGGLRLKETTLRRVLIATESLRARSVAARRDRIVNSFVVDAREAGLSPILRSADEIDVAGSQATYRIFPVVGHVDSVIAHRREARVAGNQGLLLYDPTGLLEERLDHIKWLAGKLPVGSLATTEVHSWAKTI